MGQSSTSGGVGSPSKRHLGPRLSDGLAQGQQAALAGSSCPGCATTLRTALNFCGLGWNSSDFYKMQE